MGAARATVSVPSESLYNMARGMGLDAAGLDEIWRTRQPLVTTKQGEAGEQTRVTYELSPDRTALSMHRLTEKSTPARIEASSATSLSKPQEEEWEYVPNPARLPASRFPEQNFGFDSSGNTFGDPFGSGFPHSSLFPRWGLPEGVTPRVETKTELDDQGRRVTTTTSTYSGPLSPGHSFFNSLFPDISRAPGPIQPENTPQAQSPPVGAFPSLPAGTFFRKPAFLPPLNPSNPNDHTEPTWVPVQDPTTTQRPVDLLPPASGAETDSTIDDFLARVNISAAEIEEKNGELVKTIVDKNGRVLTVRFVLSTVKGDPEKPKQEEPTK
ncbi:hypothetical protein KR059_005246 [Drosophila kikkawai]|nr:hypothetical protein KR059_005246 [Drosophila kikkawai]